MFENIVASIFFKWNFAAEKRLLEFSFNSGFTVQVIFETSRLATIVNGVLRKTTKDMEMNGKSQDIHIAMQMQTEIQLCVVPIRKVKKTIYLQISRVLGSLIIFLTRLGNV